MNLELTRNMFMSSEIRKENFRGYAKDTTDRDGRERDLETYEGYLGFKREELRGKRIADLGSGEREVFSRELKASGIEAEVFSVNPDYADAKYRNKISAARDWQKRSVAAISQELPFPDESLDKIFGLYSLSVFAHPDQSFMGNPEITRRWFLEISRTLKPGGEAVIAPIAAETVQDAFNGEYKEYIKILQDSGLTVDAQIITYGDLGVTQDISWKPDKDGKPVEVREEIDPSLGIGQARLIIKKPENLKK